MTMQNQAIPPLLNAFTGLYADYGNQAINRFSEIYDDDLVFEDPVHCIHGLAAYQDYCRKLGSRCREIRFDCHSVIHGNNEACITWTLHFRHPGLSLGKKISVEGCTLLRYEERITHHRDYLDLGELLYEHIPVIGRMIRKLKTRLSS